MVFTLPSGILYLVKINQYIKADGTVVKAHQRQGEPSVPTSLTKASFTNTETLISTHPTAKVLFTCIAGSFMYGLNHPDSDLDTRGVFFETDPSRVLGLQPLQETIEDKSTDTVLHEFGKTMKLARDGNPNILELFYAQPEVGNLFVDNFDMDMVLFAEPIRAKHHGFARGQLKRASALRQKGSEDSTEFKKLIRHGWRVIRQGIQLLEEGKLTLKVSDDEKEMYSSFYDDFELFQKEFNAQLEKLDKVKTVLPERCETDELSRFVAEKRLANLRW